LHRLQWVCSYYINVGYTKKQFRNWPTQRPSHWGNGDSFPRDKAAMFTTYLLAVK